MGVSLHLALHWRHNEGDGVSNHRRLYCLLNGLFRPGSERTPKLRITGLCEGNPPVTGEFCSQRTNNAENSSIWWRHHGICDDKFMEMCLYWRICSVICDKNKMMTPHHESRTVVWFLTQSIPKNNELFFIHEYSIPRKLIWVVR